MDVDLINIVLGSPIVVLQFACFHQKRASVWYSLSFNEIFTIHTMKKPTWTQLSSVIVSLTSVSPLTRNYFVFLFPDPSLWRVFWDRHTPKLWCGEASEAVDQWSDGDLSEGNTYCKRRAGGLQDLRCHTERGILNTFASDLFLLSLFSLCFGLTLWVWT